MIIIVNYVFDGEENHKVKGYWNDCICIKLLWENQDFAKDLPKKDNLGSKFLVGNTLMFKNYW